MTVLSAMPLLPLTQDTVLDTRAWLSTAMQVAGVGLVLAGGRILRIFVHRRRRPGALLQRIRWGQEWTLPVAFLVGGALLLVSGGEGWLPAVDMLELLYRRWVYTLWDYALTWGSPRAVDEVAAPAYDMGDMYTQPGAVVRGCPP